MQTSSSDRARKCRARSEQCRAWAELSRHAWAKEEFLKVAAQWSSLADEIEEIERMRAFAKAARQG